jgi:peroxiredoxin
MTRERFCLLAILFTLSISCKSQKAQFTIRANLKDVSDGTLFYLKSWDTNKILDSAYVRKSRLFIQGNLSSTPENFLLYATDSVSKEFLYTNLLLGKKDKNIKFNASRQDFPWNIDASGSVSQDAAEKFNQVEYEKQNILKQLKKSLQGNKKLLSDKSKQVSDSLDDVKIDLIRNNFNSYAALLNFKYYKTQFSKEALANLYPKLSPELQQSKYGKAVKMQMEYPVPEVGDLYYDYTAVNQNGDSISLSHIKNKYILLHFSSAACYYSQQSLPELKLIHKQYSENLEIVKISQDADKATWTKSIIKDSIPWTNLWDGKGDLGDAVIKYGTIGTPNYVLISSDKRIIEKWFGYEEGIILDKIKKHLDKK